MGAKDSSSEIQVIANERSITLVLFLLALFAPIFCYISSVAIYVFSATWIYVQSGYEIRLVISDILLLIPISSLRIVYVYQMNRYYQGLTTRKKTLALGFLSDGPGFFMFFLMTISYLFPSIWLYKSIPTPLLFLFGTLILWRKPFPELTAPWDDK